MKDHDVVPVTWQYDFGEMSYTVPSGWSNPEDTPGGYRLEQQDAPEFTAIYVFTDMLAHSQAPDCPDEPDLTVGASAKDWSIGSTASTASPRRSRRRQ